MAPSRGFFSWKDARLPAQRWVGTYEGFFLGNEIFYLKHKQL